MILLRERIGLRSLLLPVHFLVNMVWNVAQRRDTLAHPEAEVEQAR